MLSRPHTTAGGLVAGVLLALALASPAAAAPPRTTASFDYSPAAPQTGQAVAFDASASQGGNGPVVSYRWDFGDGTVQTNTTPLASHAYLLPGSYSVTLRVTGQGGPNPVDRTTRTLTVSAVEPPPAPPPPATPAAPPPASAEIGASPAAGLLRPGASKPAFLTPFPIVRIVGSIARGGSRIRLLGVRAPRGSTAELRCRGRGCPRSATTKQVGLSRRVTFPRFHRFLRAGITLRIYVRKPGVIGKYTRFRIRSLKRPARVDRCLFGTSRRPAACPE